MSTDTKIDFSQNIGDKTLINVYSQGSMITIEWPNPATSLSFTTKSAKALVEGIVSAIQTIEDDEMTIN